MMGRARIDTSQKLESESKKRSTFKQRGGGLQKKFEEMEILCGVQGLLIAHGPQGELIDSCNNSTMVELYQRVIESKYAEMLPLPDVSDIRVALDKRSEGHVQGLEKRQLDAEFAYHMSLVALEESIRVVTVEELETLHEEHIRLLAEALDANLEGLRNFRQQLQTTLRTSEPQYVAEDLMDRGLHNTNPPLENGSILNIQVLPASAYKQEIQNDEAGDELEDELGDEQVENIQSAGLDVDLEFQQPWNDIYNPMPDKQFAGSDVDLGFQQPWNDIYTPMPDDQDLLLPNHSFHSDDLCIFDKDDIMFNPPPHG